MRIYSKNVSNLFHLSGKFQPSSGYQLWRDFYLLTLGFLIFNISIISVNKIMEVYLKGAPPMPPKPLKKTKEKRDGRETSGQESSGKSWRGGKNGQQKKKKHS
ncbi:unnamed protein product [Caenorhabditis brenneri]